MRKLSTLLAKIEARPDKTITRREIIDHYWKGTYSEHKYRYLSMGEREAAKRVFMSQSLAPGSSLPWQSSDGYLLGYLKKTGRSTYRLRNFHDRAEALGWIQKLAYMSGSGRESIAKAFRSLDPYDARYYYMVLRSLERELTKK
jgi:hypothetical protein